MPRLPRKLVDAAELDQAKYKPRILKSTGPASKSLDSQVVDPVAEMPNKEKLDLLAMNEEFVEVVVHETTDKNASQLPDLYISGIPQRFIRGKTQSVKWKFVELLAKCRETTYTQQKFRNSDGVEDYRNVPHTALRYPFSIVNAPQKFHDRLKVLMAMS